MVFSFFNPVKAGFGAGVSNRLSGVLRGLEAECFLVVANKRAQSLSCVKDLKGRNGGEVFFFSGVEPNPSCETVDRIAGVVRENNCDVVVAVGGGSVLDAAKLAAAMLKNEGSCRDFCEGSAKVLRKGSGFVAVPTTSGTGSEASPISVITVKEQKRKVAVKSPLLFADFALVDPELTFSMPPRLTATSGLDVVSHALEGLCSKNNSFLTDLLNLKSFDLAWNNLPLAVEDGKNKKARENVMLASFLAGMCLGESGTANGHPISYCLTLEKGLEHGFACALTLPFWLEYNWNFFDAAQKVAEIMKVSSARDARKKLEEFIISAGGPSRLSLLGYSSEDLKRVAGCSFEKVSKRNVRNVSREDFEGILRKAL
ncbi:MAG: iron-containing alcohol dehydrogenase [Candidatus Micrarchaeia archaeon]